MRRIIIFIFVYFCISNQCYAAPCYGTKMPKEKQLFFGVQTYSVLKRYLEADNGTMRNIQNFILISYGIFDWLSIDLKAGVGNVKHQPDGEEENDYPEYLGGGYGLRTNFFLKDKTKMVFGFQHISIHPHTIHINGVKNKVVLDDWQLSLLLSHDLSMITPYLGTRWSRMDCMHWVSGIRNRKKSDRTKSTGLIVGVDIPLNETVWLNVEGQLFDSEAFATSLNFHF